MIRFELSASAVGGVRYPVASHLGCQDLTPVCLAVIVLMGRAEDCYGLNIDHSLGLVRTAGLGRDRRPPLPVRRKIRYAAAGPVRTLVGRSLSR